MKKAFWLAGAAGWVGVAFNAGRVAPLMTGLMAVLIAGMCVLKAVSDGD